MDNAHTRGGEDLTVAVALGASKFTGELLLNAKLFLVLLVVVTEVSVAIVAVGAVGEALPTNKALVPWQSGLVGRRRRVDLGTHPDVVVLALVVYVKGETPTRVGGVHAAIATGELERLVGVVLAVVYIFNVWRE